MEKQPIDDPERDGAENTSVVDEGERTAQVMESGVG